MAGEESAETRLASRGEALAVTDIGDPNMDALWLATLQRLCSRAAHELKGVLNGASVNLEVVRSRSSKPDVPASSVSKYAGVASDQLDAVITMTEALLSLGRETRSPVDVGLVVRKVLDLLSPVATADGRRLEASGSFDEAAKTSAGVSAVRFAIGRCLLVALDASRDARCSPAPSSEGVVVRVESLDGATLTVDDDIIAAAGGAGIRIQAESSAVSISFPR